MTDKNHRFISAILEGDLETVRKKIKAGANIRKTYPVVFTRTDDGDGQRGVTGEFTPLAAAVHTGDENIVRELLAAGAPVNGLGNRHEYAIYPCYGGSSTQKITPLYLAVENEAYAIFELLLQAGADPHIVLQCSSDAYSPVGGDLKTTITTALDLARERGYGDMVSEMEKPPREKGKEQARPSSSILLALCREAGRNKIDPAQVRLLIESGVKVNATDRLKCTPLMYAADGGNADVVKVLLAAGADPECRNNRGETALLMAARNGDALTAGHLLEAGADPDAADDGGESPLAVSSSWGFHEMVGLLLAHGAAVDLRDGRGRTPLHFAAGRCNTRCGESGHAACVRLLLARGADPGDADFAGDTPITIAEECDDREMLRALGKRKGRIAKDKSAPAKITRGKILQEFGKKSIVLPLGCIMFSAALFAGDVFSTILKNERIGPLSLGMKDAAVVAAIGRPDEKTKPTFEAATGDTVTQWTYKQKGLVVGLRKEKGGYAVTSLSAAAPCVFTTKKGIAIGATVAQVKRAYPPDTWDQESSNDGRIVVGSVYGGLIFTVRKGKVDSIFLGAAAE